MKKAFLLLIIIIGATLGAIYYFFPATQVAQAGITFKGNNFTAFRLLALNSFWLKTIHGAVQNDGGGIKLNEYGFKVVTASSNQLAIAVTKNKQEALGRMLLIGKGKDSIQIIWSTTLQGANNPVARIKTLSAKNLLQEDKLRMLYEFSQALQNTKMVYGYPIERGLMTDSLLLTTRFESVAEPNAEDIYPYILKLEKLAKDLGAASTNAPMFFVQQAANTAKYQSQVALPINKQIPATGAFAVKRMVLGNNLSTIVKGPAAEIEKATNAMRLYVTENSLTMPAIPYQSLITNRLLEKDSMKWETRIVFPIY